jgi:hypothetical protein
VLYLMHSVLDERVLLPLRTQLCGSGNVELTDTMGPSTMTSHPFLLESCHTLNHFL